MIVCMSVCARYVRFKTLLVVLACVDNYSKDSKCNMRLSKTNFDLLHSHQFCGNVCHCEGWGGEEGEEMEGAGGEVGSPILFFSAI